jgi:hypothetical protein
MVHTKLSALIQTKRPYFMFVLIVDWGRLQCYERMTPTGRQVGDDARGLCLLRAKWQQMSDILLIGLRPSNLFIRVRWVTERNTSLKSSSKPGNLKGQVTATWLVWSPVVDRCKGKLVFKPHPYKAVCECLPQVWKWLALGETELIFLHAMGLFAPSERELRWKG